MLTQRELGQRLKRARGNGPEKFCVVNGIAVHVAI